MKDLYFKERRLFLSRPGEIFVKGFSRLTYGVLALGSIFYIFRGPAPLKGLGVLVILFLLDRSFHRKEGEHMISEVMGGTGNAAFSFTPRAYGAVNKAFRKTVSSGKPLTLFLFKVLMEEKDVKNILSRLDYNLKESLEKTEKAISDSPSEKQESREYIERISHLGMQAFRNAHDGGELFVYPRHIFLALFSLNDQALVSLFRRMDLSSDDVKNALVFGRIQSSFSFIKRVPAVLGGFAHQSMFIRHRVVNRSWTSRPTPILDRFSSDLTDLARSEKAGFLIGHKKEFEELLEVISRPGKPNAILVGDPGSGKSTLIAHLAYRIIKDRVPSILFDKRLVSLNVPALLANATNEELAGRLQNIVKEILFAGNIVLFIPNMHDLFKTSGSGEMNAIDLLLPIVSSEAIPLIGESYPREFKQLISPRTDFLEQFDVITVNPISPDESIEFLIYMSVLLERQFGIPASFRAIKRSVEIAHRYFSSKPLPGSAVDLLKRVFAKASHEKKNIINEMCVEEVAETETRIPIQGAGKEETEKLLRLEEYIHTCFINQNEAVSAVSRALREYRSGLSRKGGPIATFLFVGPTGVGKTELSKILASVQFGSKDAMSRFDMSEYQDKQSIFRFIGTPDGKNTGSLTDAIMAHPYTLILLDEFEKAHPDILNLFLQVFDDGRLTDGLGRTVNFEHTVIIATSNAHSEFIKESIESGKTISDISEVLKKKLTDYFKPELINRFSDIIVFKNLGKKEIVSIAKLLLEEVVKTIQTSHGIALSFSDSAVEKIAELGYDPTFGARPLRQVISDNVRGALAEKILRKEIGKGDEIIFDIYNHTFTIQKK